MNANAVGRFPSFFHDRGPTLTFVVPVDGCLLNEVPKATFRDVSLTAGSANGGGT